MTIDILRNLNEVKQFLRGQQLTKDESVIREVVLTIQGVTGRSLYDLHAHGRRRKDGVTRRPLCSRGFIQKIQQKLNCGELTPYTAFLASTGDLPPGDETVQAPGTERPFIQPLFTLFNDLDELAGGMYPGELVILAGKPSTGKSIMAQNIMLNASRGGYTPGFFGLETRFDQLSYNMLGSEAGIDPQKLRQLLFSEREEQRIIDAIVSLENQPVFALSADDASIGGLRNSAIDVSREHHLDLLVVDYIQLIDDFPSDETTSAEVNWVAKGLKSLARELDLPVLALYQIGQDHRWRLPRRLAAMGQIPIPGGLTGYADQVLVLQRDELHYAEDEWDQFFPGRPYPRNEVSVSLVKNRRGPTGTVTLRIREYLARFEPLARTDCF